MIGRIKDGVIGCRWCIRKMGIEIVNEKEEGLVSEIIDPGECITGCAISVSASTWWHVIGIEAAVNLVDALKIGSIYDGACPVSMLLEDGSDCRKT